MSSVTNPNTIQEVFDCVTFDIYIRIVHIVLPQLYLIRYLFIAFSIMCLFVLVRTRLLYICIPACMTARHRRQRFDSRIHLSIILCLIFYSFLLLLCMCMHEDRHLAVSLTTKKRNSLSHLSHGVSQVFKRGTNH